jgi:hypothetical protein
LKEGIPDAGGLQLFGGTARLNYRGSDIREVAMLRLRTVSVALLAFLLICSTAGFAGKKHDQTVFSDGNLYSADDFSVDIEDGSVIIVNKYEDEEIEITEEYELYIDGDLIKTDARQKKHLKEFHTQVFDIRDYAIEIGLEGAKVGLQGAKIAMKAIGGVLKMLFTDYTEDDLDRDLERETDKIEDRAEDLEEFAEGIEDMAEDLEDMFYDLEEEIPAIAKLDW